MSTTMTTTSLGTSHLRGSSRQTRTNPTRSSKTIGASLRKNSLISNPPTSVQGAHEPHGFYPAITHFADAIAALPRDYRRHTSLLNEVDAKAWSPEETLQKLLTQCLSDPPPKAALMGSQNVAGTTISNAADEAIILSATNSVVGAPLDNASQYSNQSADPAVMQRRQLFAALRHNLMQIMVTMDEKNHVINNANEELSRHIRRLDNVWHHISDEISEEARLGSLKHWAYTETNPTKKPTTASSRREAAAGLAIMHDTEISQRSESRREAMLAKKQRLNQQVDSDFDESRAPSRKGVGNGKRRAVEAIEPANLAPVGAGKRKKPDRIGIGGAGMERSLSGALASSRAMSREPSQDTATKKRKAQTSASTVARKRYVNSTSETRFTNKLYSRLNANNQESPKLASSPLIGSFGKESYKRSPALSAARPVTVRARQNSTQNPDGGRGRPSSSASHRNNNDNGLSVSTPELSAISAATGKTANEVKSTMRDTVNNRGDRLVEDDTVANGELGVRGGLLLERSASKQSHAKAEPGNEDGKNSPLPAHAQLANDARVERIGRGRASKTSTPIVGTFSEAETESVSNGNGNGAKTKRPARPRMKDHGLHDSLSPKGLPVKRAHKKNGSIVQQQLSQRIKEDSEANSISAGDALDNEDEEDDNGAEDEERYCYCNGVSYGEMVACDNKDCPREWFHLECIGLKSVPKSAKWYCEECKENLAKKGKFGGNGNGNGTGTGNGGSK